MSIISHIDGHIASLQINRPEAKNALTLEMYQHMSDALRAYEQNDAVRVAVIYGQPEMFCAGNDLNDFLNNVTDIASSPIVQFLYALRDFSKPLVIAVNGVAVGIGVTMLLHADFVVVGDTARLSTPFINLALCPEGSSSLNMVQNGGYLKAAEKLMFGEPFTAQEAVHIGIATQVMPAGEVDQYAFHRAKQLAEKSPQAMRETKRLLKAHNADRVRAAMDAEIEAFARLMKGAHAREAITAFFEKRKPNFE